MTETEMERQKIQRELTVKTAEAVVTMLHVLGAGYPGTARMTKELLDLLNQMRELDFREQVAKRRAEIASGAGP